MLMEKKWQCYTALQVKGEEFDGQGVRYELDGSVWQKGKFRDGYCVSEE